MQPDNPIVGGITLRIPAIRSPDYVAGVSGWTINVDGTAEFNNVTIRGTFITGTVPGAHVTISGGQILIFDSTNTLVGQIDQNGIVALGTDGSLVRMYDVAGIARLGLLPGGGNVNEASAIAGFSGAQPQLVIRSPQQTSTSPNNQSTMLLTGATNTLPALTSINADSVALAGNNSSLNLGGTGAGPGQAAIVTPNTSIGLDGGNLSILNNITLAAGSVSFLISTMDDGTNRLYTLRALDNFDCSGTLTLTTTSTLITGCQHTYTNIKAGSKWSVIGTFDCGLGAVANTDIGELWVNPAGAGLTKQTGDASYNGGVNTRSGITRSWSGTFTAGGTIVFQLQGRQGGAGGVNVMASPGTTMQVAIYQ